MNARELNTINMQDVIQAHNGHWFDADTKRFWGTRLPQVAYETEDGIRYFVSSEFRDHRKLSRGYTIRMQLPDGSIRTLSNLNEFDSRAEATRALKQLLKGE